LRAPRRRNDAGSCWKTGLKLSGVISDIHGISSRPMLRAVVAGERDPRDLADMA
jgi:transposase